MKWKKEHNLKKLTGPNGDLNKSHDDSDDATSPKTDVAVNHNNNGGGGGAFTTSQQLSGHHLMGVMPTKVEGQG